MDASDAQPACHTQTTSQVPGSLHLSSLFHFQPTVCFRLGWVLLISRCIYYLIAMFQSRGGLRSKPEHHLTRRTIIFL